MENSEYIQLSLEETKGFSESVQESAEYDTREDALLIEDDCFCISTSELDKFYKDNPDYQHGVECPFDETDFDYIAEDVIFQDGDKISIEYIHGTRKRIFCDENKYTLTAELIKFEEEKFFFTIDTE